MADCGFRIVTVLEAVKLRGILLNFKGCIPDGVCPTRYGYTGYCMNGWGKECRECWQQPVILPDSELLENFLKSELDD